MMATPALLNQRDALLAEFFTDQMGIGNIVEATNWLPTVSASVASELQSRMFNYSLGTLAWYNETSFVV